MAKDLSRHHIPTFVLQRNCAASYLFFASQCRRGYTLSQENNYLARTFALRSLKVGA